MLNAKELIDLQIITGDISQENIQQHGIDLNVIEIESLEGVGFLPYTGKTSLPKYNKVEKVNNIWLLQPGVYNITFSQGCNIPNDKMALIRQRSSLARCGGLIHSSVFDAGFQTSQIGTMMTILYPVRIEHNARIAQIYAHDCIAIDNLYDGQYQGDKQRTSY